ncbi:hypothetical protein K438DRAFT_1945404 [Mycena galopus ATCC 62051]|nr:hypothetical protein K438DRAFT_1945404 [Mycena galopus ATCC 62051]
MGVTMIDQGCCSPSAVRSAAYFRDGGLGFDRFLSLASAHHGPTRIPNPRANISSFEFLSTTVGRRLCALTRSSSSLLVDLLSNAAPSRRVNLHGAPVVLGFFVALFMGSESCARTVTSTKNARPSEFTGAITYPLRGCYVFIANGFGAQSISDPNLERIAFLR